jgi:serine protease Do
MHGFGEVVERLRRSAVQIHLDNGRGGSGVVWNSEGLIVTNAHVARHAEARIQLWDGREFPARVAARDRRRDLALLRISAPSLEPVSLADSTALRPGALALAVGSPLGFAGALSTGAIHSIGPIDGLGVQPWVRASVRLAPGNSGGPLADAGGRLIGINTAVVNGLGIAVPSNLAADFVRRGPTPALGVTLRPVSLGLQILEVDPDSAAAAASLRPGDILLLSLDDLHSALDSAGELLRVRFLRGEPGRKRLPVRETTVRLCARAAEAA